MKFIELFPLIFFVHWVADFVSQSDWEAKNKSSSWFALLYHTASYSTLWLIPLLFIMDVSQIVTFIGITFVCHTITDYFTSRWNKKLWDKGNVHGFFVCVGFDQMLHYIQLFYTLYFLS